MPNVTMTSFYRINVVVLWTQRKSNYKVSLLSAWVGIYTCKQRYAEAFCDIDVTCGLERHIRYRKPIGIGVKTCGIGYNTCCCSPVASGKTERDAKLRIRRIGTVAFAVDTVVATKVGVPLYGTRTKS